MSRTISLAMIVRNEETTLPRALASVAPWVDEMIVVDTGSEDNTIGVAEQAGARVIRHVWDGFSASRNRSLEACTSDWIFVLDADEELDEQSGESLRLLAARDDIDGFVCTQRNYLEGSLPADIPVIRFFKNTPRLRFSGLLHERVRSQDGPLQQTLSDLLIHHRDAQSSHDPSSAKSRVYEEILRKGISNGSGTAEDLLFLGVMLRRKGAYREAVSVLGQCIRESNAKEPQLATAYETLAVCHYELGEIGRAENICKQGLKQFPGFPPLHYNLGLCQWRAGKYKDGRRSARAAIETANNYRGLIPIDPNIRGGLAERLYGACRGK